MKQFKKTVTCLFLLAVACYVSYFEGYRRGCNDTMNVVEDRADKLIKIVEKRLFGE